MALRARAGRLRGAAREHRRGLAWLTLALVMVLGPLVFNLARAPGFTASVEIFPIGVGPFGPVHDPEYYEGFLAQPKLRQEMDENLPGALDEADFRNVEIRATDRGTLVVSSEHETPVEARDFVRVLGPQLQQASARDLAARADAAARDVEVDLRASRRRSDRLRLRRDLAELRRLARSHSPRILPGRPPETPRLESWADRLADRLPGEFSGRPSPVWAALAGLLVVATLRAVWIILFAFRPPRAARR